MAETLGNTVMRESTSAQAIRRLRRYFKHTMRNPEWTIMDFSSRFVTVRELLKKFRKPLPDDFYPVSKSALALADIDRLVHDVDEDGFAFGLGLPDELLSDLISYAWSATCYGNGKPQFGLRYEEKAAAEKQCGTVFSQAEFFDLDNSVPAIARLSCDPLLLSISARYFGSQPVYTDSRLWWTFATRESEFDVTHTSCFFHFDKDDYASLRFFFYLTDVDEETGPHKVVRKSHKKKKLSQLISLGERGQEEIEKMYGSDSIVTVCGSAGSGFADDPFCFHRATRPTAKDRLLLQLRFATKDHHIFSKPDLSSCRNILG